MPSVATAMICPPWLLLRSEGPGVPFQGHAAADPPAVASCGRSEPRRRAGTHSWPVAREAAVPGCADGCGSGAGAAGARAHDRLKVLGVVPRGPGAAGRGRLATRTGYIAHTVTAG